MKDFVIDLYTNPINQAYHIISEAGIKLEHPIFGDVLQETFQEINVTLRHEVRETVERHTKLWTRIVDHPTK